MSDDIRYQFDMMQTLAEQLCQAGLFIALQDSKTGAWLLEATQDVDAYMRVTTGLYDDVVANIRTYESITTYDTVFTFPDGRLKARIAMTPTVRSSVILN